MGELIFGYFIAGLFAIIGAIIFYYLSGKDDLGIPIGILFGGGFGVVIFMASLL